MQTLAKSVTPNVRTDAGLFCYIMTPYDAGGDIDAGVLREYASATIESGVDGLTCIASTCEGPYLTERERLLVMKVVGDIARGKAKLNVGVGATSPRQVVEYAKVAEECGATSLMVDMQTYFPLTFEQAYSYYETIAASAKVPIRLYNIPGGTKFDFSPDQIARLSPIKQIASVKEASGDVTRVRDIKSLCGDRFEIFCGFHFMAVDACKYGATGWEAGMHPLVAPLHVQLYQALYVRRDIEAGAQLYERLQDLFYFFKWYGVPQSLKAMADFTDLKLGKPRLPLSELSPSAKFRLKQILSDLDLISS